MKLNQLISSIFRAQPEEVHLELQEKMDTSGLSQICVDSDNFDIEVNQSNDSHLEYKLSIKKGYELKDMTFDKIVNGSQLSFFLKTRRNNMSGVLELFVPASLTDFKITCVNGDVNVSKVSISNMSLKTTNGDIEVIAKDNQYQISCHTVNGDVNNKRSSVLEASNKIECSTVNGDITIK